MTISLTEAAATWRRALREASMPSMSDAELIDLVTELELLKNTMAATQARAADELRMRRESAVRTDEDRAAAVRSVGSEVALARRESPWWGSRHVALARVLVGELVCTMELLAEGMISERHALVIAQQTATLSAEDREEVDRRLAPVLGHLSVRQAEAAALRVAAELDAASLVARREAAVRARRVTVRPAPDGMAYLSILGPLPEVIGAYAALTRQAKAVAAGLAAEEPAGRPVGAIAADTALRLLSGRAEGEPQAVEIQLVMTDRALLGSGDVSRSVREPARIVGHGSLPASAARGWLRDVEARVWFRRLYTDPTSEQVVAMDSRRRSFTGRLRDLVILRDDTCSTPWCDAPVVHADHTVPVRDGAPTSLGNGSGRCARCNFTKEHPGWAAWGALDTGPPGVTVRTPTGHTYTSSSPPVLGWGEQVA